MDALGPISQETLALINGTGGQASLNWGSQKEEAPVLVEVATAA